MIQCQVSDCKNGATKHLSRKFGIVMALCTRHHIAMHRLEQNQSNGIPISVLRKTLGEKRWKKLMKRWELKVDSDGRVHVYSIDEKVKVVFT